MMSSSFGANSESDDAERVVASLSTPMVSEPPIERSSCLICRLVGVAVPSLATRPASCATPGCVLYAVPRPASSESATVIFGTLCSGTRTTVNPLSSFDSEIAGQLIGRGGAGGGGVACAKTFAASAKIATAMKPVWHRHSCLCCDCSRRVRNFSHCILPKHRQECLCHTS